MKTKLIKLIHQIKITK